MLPRWFAALAGRHDPHEEVAAKLYGAAVAQARQPSFYLHCGVPDTVDGRFDAIALHVWLVLRHLRAGGAMAEAVAQALFDVFMGDMDRSLREMGAGDLGVGKRVKAMAQALMGRVKAYDEGLASADPQALSDALKRNLLRGTEKAPDDVVSALAAYVARVARALAGRGIAGALAGQVDFGPPPEFDPLSRDANLI